MDDAGRRAAIAFAITRRCKGLNLPPLGGDSTFSGPLLTKTLLIYALTTGGTARWSAAGGLRQGDRQGAWRRRTCPGAAIGTPMTYLVDGRQYIALTVQGASAARHAGTRRARPAAVGRLGFASREAASLRPAGMAALAPVEREWPARVARRDGGPVHPQSG